ncbi:hypothetical protein NLM65_07595 [Klebsiella variicola]|uniref:hypothetical protein n=1 Tax=Klebsiella variicola TaxID=244366 RepID=UPI0020B78F20|nr:hypothetical protein [Klebsiella variicola]MCP3435521.1 hypothetical protein [Klebsiella variicola]
MNKYILPLVLILNGYSMFGFADDSVNYEYDKSNNIIYAQKDGKKGMLKFNEDYTGNPSYSFVFFSDSPAIIADSRSLHDSTVYATLKYSGNKFTIDCLYSNIKSKKNGVLIKEGVCGLDMAPAERYADFIEEKVGEVEGDMDSIDTSLILSGKVNYLPIIIYNDKDKLIYKLYNDKQALLDDDYSILSLNSGGKCEVFENSPWVIYNNKEFKGVEIMNERSSDGKIALNKSVSNKSDSNECSSYPPISVIQPKSYFYDSAYKVKKSYLIKGDKVNLLSVSADGKWCKTRYFNIKSKAVDNIISCADLSI